MAAHRPVSLRLSQSFGSRYFHVARAMSGRSCCNQRMCEIESLPDSAGAPPVQLDPRAQLARVVALHAHRAADDALRVVAAPRASIQMIASCSGVAVAIDRHRARPLRRHRDRDDVVGADAAPRPSRVARRATIPPHHASGDCSTPPSGSSVQLDRREVAVDELPVDGEERDLRARRAEVDREHVIGPRGAAYGRDAIRDATSDAEHATSCADDAHHQPAARGAAPRAGRAVPRSDIMVLYVSVVEIASSRRCRRATWRAAT